MQRELPPSDPPAGAASDWTIPQDWDGYAKEDHAVWVSLYDRQMALLAGRACSAYLRGLEALDLRGDGVPDFDRLNARLSALTGWRIVAVPGLVPDAVFFDHLANRRFPAGRFIRSPDNLDYLEEPDVFHDVFGHAPLLADAVFGDYMQAYGEGGLRALRLGRLHNLARLYWYTVEFGLMLEDGALRLYGAGIVSSAGETLYALEDPRPRRLRFDLRRVMRTPYRIDAFQGMYFVVESLGALLEATLQDFGALYPSLAGASDIDLDAVLPEDRPFPDERRGDA